MISIIDYFEEKVGKYAENPLVWEKTNGEYKATSYKDCHDLVRIYAAAFIEAGIRKGDRIALLSEGRRDWLIGELSILYAGAVNVPLSTKLEEASDLIFRINHSDSRFIIVSGTHLGKIRRIKDKMPLLEKIIVLDSPNEIEEKEVTWDILHHSGLKFIDKNESILNERRKSIKPDDMANISYTSGTSADPKGIMLSHRNYTANVEQAFSFIDIPSHYRTLVVLPWDHAFAHTAALYAFMYRGASVAAVKAGSTPSETLKNFTTNIMEVKPHVLMSVPALAKNFKKGIEKGIRDKGKIASILFRMALAHAYWYNGTGDNRGNGLKILTRPFGLLFDKILFKTIRSRFGGNLQFFIGGGALLDIELQKFFYALGTPMYQGYGLSEAAPIISANTPKYHKMGSSGKIVQNLQLKITDENGNSVKKGISGEIVVKGENIMLGYWKNESATSETIKDGWLYTGDLGFSDKDNYLYVLGRFKSLLISHDGEKYSPEGIEEAIIDHCPLIDQFMLYNNQSPYTVGIAVPNPDAAKQLLKGHHFENNETRAMFVLNAMQDQIAQFKKGGRFEDMFPQRWLPVAIAIVPQPFTELNKMLNSTMKMVRRVIETEYTEKINFMFTPEAKSIANSQNIDNMNNYLTK
jgi:long-chain acyl-CoA synthetase